MQVPLFSLSVSLSLSSFRGVSDFFLSLSLVLFRPKLLPEAERRRENMVESGGVGGGDGGGEWTLFPVRQVHNTEADLFFFFYR